MASMRDIKRRRESILSTEQITKAMMLVATVKLQKARQKAEASRPYTNALYRTVGEILRRTDETAHKYLRHPAEGKKAVILITGNRGLAGGYNSNAVRQVLDGPFDRENTVIYTLGRKGQEMLRSRGYTCADDWSEVVNAPLYKDAISITQTVLDRFEAGEISEIWLVYTEFKNTVVHVPKCIRMIPVAPEDEHVASAMEEEREEMLPMNYEPNDEEVLNRLIPQYMASVLYGALLQSVASENGARMTAMDNATDNAEEMIDKLSLQYNRARQGSITQELTEIIAGRNAVT
ncbi:MAG: ATP synthase F1 subunit gamma [Lachnospiraceae bacterium]|nr:ATP synthase F1 subunit gamma [Lachnospiraceae bacterium]